jgi:demethylmenaquinone methyltransferase/2-methoxy-6-polyprenyl-1,4-benzoquinol methylase
MQFSAKEVVREQEFGDIWYKELDDVFADVARYYDRANHVASLGLWNYFRDRFQSTIEVKAGQHVLDVCAGTNAVGIALLEREPTLKVHAIDRSAAMQEVGRARALARGFQIDSTIGDVHRLPFPDNSFDVVTLQWASRHLRVMDVFGEIHRVLRPGGHFYHCDMERPDSRFVELAYYGYLRFCLAFTALVFRSSEAAKNCKKYFIHTLSMFYSANELSQLLRELGYKDVRQRTIFGGMIGYHRAVK